MQQVPAGKSVTMTKAVNPLADNATSLACECFTENGDPGIGVNVPADASTMRASMNAPLLFVFPTAKTIAPFAFGLGPVLLPPVLPLPDVPLLPVVPLPPVIPLLPEPAVVPPAFPAADVPPDDVPPADVPPAGGRAPLTWVELPHPTSSTHNNQANEVMTRKEIVLQRELTTAPLFFLGRTPKETQKHHRWLYARG